MITTGETFWLCRTGARFHVLETSGDGRRGIAGGERTGGRILVIETAHDGYYARDITDNGGTGTLLDTLTPHGPRYRIKPVAR